MKSCFPIPRGMPPGDARTLGRQIRSVRVNGTEVLDQLVGVGVHRLETDGEDRWRWTAGSMPFYAPVADTIQSVQVDGEVARTGPAAASSTVPASTCAPTATPATSGSQPPTTVDSTRRPIASACRSPRSCSAGPTWDRLGPLAAPYFAYYEDVDWCWRAQLARLRVRYEPRMRVVHRWSATSGGASGPGVRVLSESNRSLTIARNAPRAWPSTICDGAGTTVRAGA